MAGTVGRRPMRADARRNYERLLSTARDAFLEHGAEAPLEDIARHADVGIGTLYRHFPTRLALQEAVYREQIEQISARAYELLDTLPPGDALADWMRVLGASTARRRGLLQTLKAVIDKDSELFGHCHDELRGAAAAVLARAQEAGEVRADVTPSDLLRLTHAFSLATERSPEDADRMLSILRDGLRPQR